MPATSRTELLPPAELDEMCAPATSYQVRWRVESDLLALCPLPSSVAAALFSDSTMQLLRHGDANAIHGCKPHLGSNFMVTMTSERIIEQVSERVGVRKKPPLRRMSDVRMRCFLIQIMLMQQIFAYCGLVSNQYILPFWDHMQDR